MNFSEIDLVKYSLSLELEGQIGIIEYCLPKEFNILPSYKESSIMSAYPILKFQKKFTPYDEIIISASIIFREVNPIYWLIAKLGDTTRPILIRTFAWSCKTQLSDIITE